MRKYEKVVQLKRDLVDAELWAEMQNKQGGRRPDSFKVSPSHSEIRLVRCGQYSEGGRNYHDSPKVLNAAMIRWITSNIDTIQSESIELIKRELGVAVLDCQALVKEVQAEIDAITDVGGTHEGY